MAALALIVRGELTAMHEFTFEAAPQAFHGGVVVTVAGSAHAGDDAGLRQPLAVSRTGILHPAIRVMNQARPWVGVVSRPYPTGPVGNLSSNHAYHATALFSPFQPHTTVSNPS